MNFIELIFSNLNSSLMSINIFQIEPFDHCMSYFFVVESYRLYTAVIKGWIQVGVVIF